VTGKVEDIGLDALHRGNVRIFRSGEHVAVGKVINTRLSDDTVKFVIKLTDREALKKVCENVYVGIFSTKNGLYLTDSVDNPPAVERSAPAAMVKSPRFKPRLRVFEERAGGAMMEKITNADDLAKAMIAAESQRTEAVNNLLKVLNGVAESVKRIEAQPMTVAQSAFRPVEKGTDP
jgi:hypothetical protein